MSDVITYKEEIYFDLGNNFTFEHLEKELIENKRLNLNLLDFINDMDYLQEIELIINTKYFSGCSYIYTVDELYNLLKKY